MAGVEMLILPLIFSLATIINTFFLLIFFQKKFGNLVGVLKKVFRDCSLTAVGIGVITYLLLAILGSILNLKTFLGIFLQGLGAGIGGILFGIVILMLLKNREFKEITESLRRKIYKREIPLAAAEPEKLP